MQAASIWRWAWFLLAGMGVVSAFLPTKLNFSDPALEPFFCPNDISGLSWDHKAITREALRREVRRFFLEFPPPSSNGTFSIPEDATLTQIFRLYYGPTSSPTRFIKAVNSIAWSNAMTEAGGQVRFDARHHMDGERIADGHALLQGRYQQLVSTITVDEAFPFARELLGTSLNSIQDFYSQTTWLELGHTEILQELGLPGMDIGEVAAGGEAACVDCAGSDGECFDNVILGGKLSSGYYEYDVQGGSAFVVHKPEGVGMCIFHGCVHLSSSRCDSSCGRELTLHSVILYAGVLIDGRNNYSERRFDQPRYDSCSLFNNQIRLDKGALNTSHRHPEKVQNPKSNSDLISNP
ncbi:von Willebrand factor A domain-containing protein 7-like [Penaeus japonicus]|uniref:von Willebrand factor A domain-containing protein 7-like n=1 Tax=Penaeus japonicus TaxID=27405 RepID=UPI001C711A37|nr:von Willebrand factor A domain-containing protein 7-like [Penaeus japonicus]